MATHPFDVIKVRTTFPGQLTFSNSIRADQDATSLGKQIPRFHENGEHNLGCKLFFSVNSGGLQGVQQRGLIGFFDGATLRVSRKILSSAIAWAVYEGILIFIRTN